MFGKLCACSLHVRRGREGGRDVLWVFVFLMYGSMYGCLFVWVLSAYVGCMDLSMYVCFFITCLTLPSSHSQSTIENHSAAIIHGGIGLLMHTNRIDHQNRHQSRYRNNHDNDDNHNHNNIIPIIITIIIIIITTIIIIIIIIIINRIVEKRVIRLLSSLFRYSFHILGK